MVSETEKKAQRETRVERWRKRLLQPPRFTILGDQPLSTENVRADSFDLPGRIGPIYDILRHPDTPTPMAMAIYGDWGAGKTSAMRWLDGQLKAWRKDGQAKDKITVRSAWFYPWKYQTKEDVWRGLVAEIIIACIEADDPSAKAYLAAIKDFGAFLGKSFVSVIASSKLSLGLSEEAKLILDGKSAEEIAQHAEELFSPQNAFLNEFETTVRNWIRETLGKRERMVVFIDDLDRCLPEVALQVLEALKLYLDIENLVFVVGVDREVVDSLVREHYKKLGLEEEKSSNYLAKMFSVETTLGPSDSEIDTFLDDLLDRNVAWQNLENKERWIFRATIRKLAIRSPREAKRLINSSLMAGEGARMSTLADDPAKQAPTVSQGMQAFFVHRILHHRYTRGSLVGQEHGRHFFTAWSQILQGNENAPRAIAVPPDYIDKLKVLQGQQEMQRGAESGSDAKAELKKTLSDLPGPYRPLLEDDSLADLFVLLQDEDLGNLMRLPYSGEVAAIAGELGKGDAKALVREAIARQLGKAPEQLTASDYQNIRILHLSDQKITDLTPLRALSNLQTINLQRATVSDLAPLSDLTKLQGLVLSNTEVRDLTPLHALTGLKKLALYETEVSDLAPLQDLTNLNTLELNYTRVSDLAPLRALTGLERLMLRNTQVSDLAPLGGLTKLRWLWLGHTRVSNLAPLRALTSLEELQLEDTEVCDLTPLHSLKHLQRISLRGAPVPKEQVDALHKALPNASITRS